MCIKILKVESASDYQVYVMGTENEIIACSEWCVNQFGFSNPTTWDSKLLDIRDGNTISRIKSLRNGTHIFHSQYRFSTHEQFNWFVLRWS